MKVWMMTLFIVVVSSCDTPQRTRNPYGQVQTASGTDDDTTTTQGTDVDDGTSNVTDDSTTTTPEDTSNGFEECNLNYQFHKATIGYFALCRSSESENQFKTKLSLTDSTSGTCFVPVHLNSTNGTSFKLGIPECVKHTAGKEYDFTLTKERDEEINAVMVIKYSALSPYLDCMNAKVNFINSYPNCIYDAGCLQAADNYATNMCNQFVQYYSDYYKQVIF